MLNSGKSLCWLKGTFGPLSSIWWRTGSFKGCRKCENCNFIIILYRILKSVQNYSRREKITNIINPIKCNKCFQITEFLRILLVFDWSTRNKSIITVLPTDCRHFTNQNFVTKAWQETKYSLRLKKINCLTVLVINDHHLKPILLPHHWWFIN